MFMVEDSKEKELRKNLVESDTAFSLVCDHLEAISSDESNRKAIAEYAKAQGPMKMDLSALAPQGAGAHQPQADAQPDPDGSLDAIGNAKCLKCEGVGHRQADCISKPDVQLACNKCGGWFASGKSLCKQG